MPKHQAEPELDKRDRLDRLSRRVGAALQEYLTELRGADDGALVLEWAACVEWSNPETERRRAAGRLIVCEADRISQSTIEGLGVYMAGMSR